MVIHLTFRITKKLLVIRAKTIRSLLKKIKTSLAFNSFVTTFQAEKQRKDPVEVFTERSVIP